MYVCACAYVCARMAVRMYIEKLFIGTCIDMDVERHGVTHGLRGRHEFTKRGRNQRVLVLHLRRRCGHGVGGNRVDKNTL